MPLTDPQIMNSQAELPRAVSLWRSLQSLLSVASFMNSGAHPDDETSSLLAALRLRDGFSVSYACANRGEGGQNAIGTESSQDLGVVRTAEMERAADVLDMSLYWLSQNPSDSIRDFGFSKSGAETLVRWNHDHALRRLVEVFRRERPDIVCTTFLDMPGQHGHHRAMTQLTHEAFDAAADPAFHTPGLAVWQTTKLYLPAWSGAGDAYDDDFQPPAATLTVDISGVEAVTGWSWLEIGQLSRVHHRTQGMGLWTAFREEHKWPLHLSRRSGVFADEQLLAGLSSDLAALARDYGSGDWASCLDDAQSECFSALEIWPVYADVAKHAAAALRLVRRAAGGCPADVKPLIQHKLERKQLQLSRVLKYAHGVRARCALADDFVRPGQVSAIEIQSNARDLRAELVLPPGWRQDTAGLHVPTDASTDPYPETFDPLLPRLPVLSVTIDVDGLQSSTLQPFEVPPAVLPARSARLSPEKILINRQASASTAAIKLLEAYPVHEEAELHAPDGWSVVHESGRFLVTPPAQADNGLVSLPLTLDGHPAQSFSTFTYTHISPRIRTCPTACQIRIIDTAMPAVRLGYMGGGNDRVNYWLRAIGFDVMDISDEQINAKSLAELDTIVVGVFTFRTRPALKQRISLVHDWIKQGGHLVTLYHRPWDNWDPATIPPRSLVIGKPSLRWRVTDATATVTHLLPEHTLLNYPNRISEQDWQGWHKERGLYFAMSWDDAYDAPLSMHDPDESPHTGALLSARIGAGRHTHTALILHHQMEQLVPGAFNLMANLVAPCR